LRRAPAGPPRRAAAGPPRRDRGRHRRARLSAALVAASALALAGCGGTPARDPHGPREAATAFLQRLASGDVRGMCRSLSGNGSAELAHDFGGVTCAESAAAATAYVAERDDLRRAIRGVRILPNIDVPLSPAPLRAGATTAALRLVVDDPVLRSRQAFDVGLRREAGRWRVDAGMQALFTLVRAPAAGDG
jgi:hypothetical protein